MWKPTLPCCWPQVEDAINQTSQTLQLLIEHDPVPQRLDQLRLDTRLSPHMQSTGHTLMLSTLDTKENQEGTLRRRSLRRSNSISKSPGPSSPKEPLLLSRDISRSESLRCSSSYSQQIFRPCDLIHGEVLGKGFFGQAIKVSTGSSRCTLLPPTSFIFSFKALLCVMFV